MRTVQFRARLAKRRRFGKKGKMMGSGRGKRKRRSILSINPSESNQVAPQSSITPIRSTPRSRSNRLLSGSRSNGHRQIAAQLEMSAAAQKQKQEELEQEKELRKARRVSQRIHRVTRQQKKRVYGQVISLISSDEEDNAGKSSNQKAANRKPSYSRASFDPLSSDEDDFESTKRRLPFTATVSPAKRARPSPKKGAPSGIAAEKVESSWASKKKKTKGISYSRDEAIGRGLADDEIEEVKVTKKAKRKQQRSPPKLKTVPIGVFQVGGERRAGEVKSRIASQQPRKKPRSPSKPIDDPDAGTSPQKPCGTRRPPMSGRQTQVGGYNRRNPIKNIPFANAPSRSKTLTSTSSSMSPERKKQGRSGSNRRKAQQIVEDNVEPVEGELHSEEQAANASNASASKKDDEENERLRKLTDAEGARFKKLTKKSGSASLTVRVDCAGITLQYQDLKTLVGNRWLNDEIINSFVALINERNKQFFSKDENNTEHSKMEYEASNGDEDVTRLFERPRPKTHIFNSFFMTRLECGEDGYDYSGVRRWLKKSKYDIKALDLIMCPVNLGNIHWVLAGIDVRAREFLYLDSMGGSNSNVLEVLKKWYVDEYRDKYGVEVDVEDWNDIYNPTYLPKQRDQGSCGAFVLYTADYLELGKRPNFTQKDMVTLRKRTALFLDRNRLADHPVDNVNNEEEESQSEEE